MTFATAGSASMRWLATGGELLLLIWAIPAGILLFGLPIVLALRLLVEGGAMLFGR
jgi:hypothetical protein